MNLSAGALAFRIKKAQLQVIVYQAAFDKAEATYCNKPTDTNEKLMRYADTVLNEYKGRLEKLIDERDNPRKV